MLTRAALDGEFQQESGQAEVLEFGDAMYGFLYFFLFQLMLFAVNAEINPGTILLH